MEECSIPLLLSKQLPDTFNILQPLFHFFQLLPQTLGNATGCRMNALNIGLRDTVNGITLRFNAFGRSTDFSEFRFLLGYRWALYDDFLVAELLAGPQWRREIDWDTELRIETGVSLVF